MRNLIIIPTYNEATNIGPLINVIRMTPLRFHPHLLVVDDHSPDGTGETVNALKRSDPNLDLLSRPEKRGLGKAYAAGFKWGLARSFDWMIQMDADFSHKPDYLPEIENLISAAKADFLVSTRYRYGGGTVHWGRLRKLISRGGNIYASVVLNVSLSDLTGGFNAWSRRVIQSLPLDSILSDGYGFQVELKYRALQKGFRAEEFPIVFEDRRVGQSKISKKIVAEAFFNVLRLRFGTKL